ncbi:S8 family serine peptidase [Streptomyces justiciae]|uniref:S8 family serine peptidase n=1 Tax=Streptomyces justiciae TaxID=2780140 RepID=UPI001880478B|nr:S8 family serine peptidase [Streptomyces justiciae]MBE8472126.1 S8 family serine peptidase [Streptomyces justiciae]MCW8375992.1 S8 family serine peptidase [Streptomyces justiciae]
MDRKKLEELFYGKGPRPVPWATDCPVRFDALLALAHPPEDATEPREDLILAINEEHGVQQILQSFRDLHMMGDTQPIASGSFIAAKLTLREVVQTVLPKTNLNRVLRDVNKLARKLGGAGVADALREDDPGTAGPGAVRQRASDVHDNSARRQERTRHQRWFLRLLAAIVAESNPALVGKRPSDKAVCAEVAGMLTGVRLEEADTEPAVDPGAQGVLDRRQRYPILSVTANRQASSAVVRSRATIKADAAEQVFSVDCSAIGWAVVDSGIDARHPAFYDWDTTTKPEPMPLRSRIPRAFNFVGVRRTLSLDALNDGRIDWPEALPYAEIDLAQVTATAQPSVVPRYQQYTTPVDPHGTHIAGIIGGWWPRPEEEFRGICPRIQLYDFRVLGDAGSGDEFSIVTALQAIRYINEQAGRFVIAGVNLSLSVPHDVASHSTGWTPVCIECDRLVRSGVVVVAAAGNSGYAGAVHTLGKDYRGASISDPGNAESVITVGSTHRSNPHRHGVSYFSSRGPTGDGRPKPDLLAPGEDIDGPVPDQGIAALHGTSQAAAHVSGAAAMVLARNRELIGRPEQVKQILCRTATDLGRERHYQGSGLVDVLRAMQSV